MYGGTVSSPPHPDLFDKGPFIKMLIGKKRGKYLFCALCQESRALIRYWTKDMLGSGREAI